MILRVTEPITTLTIASLAFQKFIEGSASELAKKFTGEAIAMTIIIRFGNLSAVYDDHWPNRLCRLAILLASRFLTSLGIFNDSLLLV